MEEKEPEPKKVEEKEPEAKKVEEIKVEPKKVEEIKPEPIKVDEKEPEAKKVEEKKPEAKKVEEKKPEAKKVEEKEPEEKKVEEEKPRKAVPRREDIQDEILSKISPLIFGKYDLRDVKVDDPGLERYINLTPVAIPHTGAKYSNRWFGKAKVNIVERLINNMMRTEHTTGKKTRTYKTVKNAFDVIAHRTKKNPIQIFVYALQNSSPKEEITRLRFGGISVPKAVDTSSSRRLDIALRNLCKGAVNSSHRNKKRMEICLAEEIILASKADMNSFAVSKKEELERIAASAR